MKNIKSSNILKKSFTLVELSVVLLVLSILTGTLLVGRKIVDRANVQRIIFEIDRYKTEFYQFQDTFGVLPGNVDTDTCMKSSEFYAAQTIQDKKDGKQVEIGKYCDGANAKTIHGYNSLQIMATEYNWGSFFNAMRFMKTAGMLENVNSDITSYDYNYSKTTSEDGRITETGTNFAGNVDGARGPKDGAETSYISYSNVKNTQGIPSFDKDGAITYAGVAFDKNVSIDNRYTYANFIRGSNGLVDNKHEFSNAVFSNSIDNKNFIVFYRNVSSVADSTYGVHQTSTGLVSSTIMNQLDVKVDDGRPGTGKVLAMKNGYAHQVDETEKKLVCYNQIESKVDQGYYVKDKDVKFGCNFIYVL